MNARQLLGLSVLAAVVVGVTPAALAERAAKTKETLPSPRTMAAAKGVKGLRQRLFGARVKRSGQIDGNHATQTDSYRYIGNGTLERTRSTMKRRVYREGYGGGAERWDLVVTRREKPRERRATIKTRLRNYHTVETQTTHEHNGEQRSGPVKRKERTLRGYFPSAEDWRRLF